MYAFRSSRGNQDGAHKFSQVRMATCRLNMQAHRSQGYGYFMMITFKGLDVEKADFHKKGCQEGTIRANDLASVTETGSMKTVTEYRVIKLIDMF